MTDRARSTFTVDRWEQEAYDERDGTALARARATKTFHGEIEGGSTAELLLATSPGESAAYVGLERLEVTVGGRRGSFVLLHSATRGPDGQSATWSVVPDSGTDGLEGLRGEARIEIAEDGTHTLTLEYDLP